MIMAQVQLRHAHKPLTSEARLGQPRELPFNYSIAAPATVSKLPRTGQDDTATRFLKAHLTQDDIVQQLFAENVAAKRKSVV